MQYSYLDPLQNLEHKVAVVGIPQGLLGLVDDVVEVAVQQLHDDVNLVVVFAHEQIFQRHDVFLGSQVPEAHANRSEGVF